MKRIVSPGFITLAESGLLEMMLWLEDGVGTVQIGLLFKWSTLTYSQVKGFVEVSHRSVLIIEGHSQRSLHTGHLLLT